MGYIPWGHKESDMTEQLTPSLQENKKCSVITWKVQVVNIHSLAVLKLSISNIARSVR